MQLYIEANDDEAVWSEYLKNWMVHTLRVLLKNEIIIV